MQTRTLIIAEGHLHAWHERTQFSEKEIRQMYPPDKGFTVVPWEGDIPDRDPDTGRIPDPRTAEQAAKDAAAAYQWHREAEYPEPRVCVLMMYEALKRMEREAQRIRGMNGLDPDQFPHSEFVKLIDKIHAKYPSSPAAQGNRT